MVNKLFKLSEVDFMSIRNVCVADTPLAKSVLRRLLKTDEKFLRFAQKEFLKLVSWRHNVDGFCYFISSWKDSRRGLKPFKFH